MLGSLFGSFTGALGKRFFITTWLPSLLLISGILAEVAAAVGVPRVTDWVQSFPGIIQAAWVALFLLVVTLAAALMSVNTTSLLRLCEGYWGDGWVHRHIGCRRRARYKARIADLYQRHRGYQSVYQRFPPKEYLDLAMPTRVGNILRSAEIYPYARYGIDAVLVWPRLYQAASDSFRNTLAAARTAMDQMVCLMACGLAFSLLGTATAVALLPWYAAPLCFAAGMVLAVVSYRGLVSACVPYAETVRTGFDLYRGKLLATIGWHAAPSPETERYQWRQIGNLWFRISPEDPSALGYRPFPDDFQPPPVEKAEDPVDSASRCADATPMVHLWWRIGAAAVVVAVIAGLVGAARERSVIPSPFPSLAVVVTTGRIQAFSAIKPTQLRIEHRGWSPSLSGLATTSKQVIGHVLTTDVSAGQPVQVRQIGPVVPQHTVPLGATLSPAESLVEQVRPGDLVHVTPVCSGESRDSLARMAAVTILDVRDTSAISGSLPARVTVVLAIPACFAAQAARALLTCQVALTPAS
jgi:hypothetical protein